MKEMLLVGRGGEGVVVASQLLADTLARAGFFVQSFPEFKAERRGAPISAFVRFDSRPIHRRYKVRSCDVLLAMSQALPAPHQLASLRDGGLLLVNREDRLPCRGPFEIARVPASRIARENRILSVEGRPMGNVASTGACVRLLLPDGLPLLEEAIRARMGAAAAPNLVAARAGYARCRRQRARETDARLDAIATPAPPRPPILFPVSTTDSLDIRTGAWAVDRPALHEECTACALCALFCPEAAITRADGTMTIDYDHCKGCGICAEVCPVHGALAMEEVHA